MITFSYQRSFHVIIYTTMDHLKRMAFCLCALHTVGALFRALVFGQGFWKPRNGIQREMAPYGGRYRVAGKKATPWGLGKKACVQHHLPFMLATMAWKSRID
jgi:hypothetical protein